MTFGVIVVLMLVYLAPTGLAAARNHRQFGAILALNLLLGWTFIGWVLALVWALTHPAAAPAAPMPSQGIPPQS